MFFSFYYRPTYNCLPNCAFLWNGFIDVFLQSSTNRFSVLLKTSLLREQYIPNLSVCQAQISSWLSVDRTATRVIFLGGPIPAGIFANFVQIRCRRRSEICFGFEWENVTVILEQKLPQPQFRKVYVFFWPLEMNVPNLKSHFIYRLVYLSCFWMVSYKFSFCKKLFYKILIGRNFNAKYYGVKFSF